MSSLVAPGGRPAAFRLSSSCCFAVIFRWLFLNFAVRAFAFLASTLAFAALWLAIFSNLPFLMPVEGSTVPAACKWSKAVVPAPLKRLPVTPNLLRPLSLLPLMRGPFPEMFRLNRPGLAPASIPLISLPLNFSSASLSSCARRFSMARFRSPLPHFRTQSRISSSGFFGILFSSSYVPVPAPLLPSRPVSGSQRLRTVSRKALLY